MQVKSKLKGHTKRITGLAFSHVLNVLVSSGADAQVIVVQFRFASRICLFYDYIALKELLVLDLQLVFINYSPIDHAVGNAIFIICHMDTYLCLLCRFVCGILMDGKSRKLDSCNFLLGGLHQHRQIHEYSFIRIRSASWLYMKLSLPFMRQQN